MRWPIESTREGLDRSASHLTPLSNPGIIRIARAAAGVRGVTARLFTPPPTCTGVVRSAGRVRTSRRRQSASSAPQHRVFPTGRTLGHPTWGVTGARSCTAQVALGSVAEGPRQQGGNELCPAASAGGSTHHQRPLCARGGGQQAALSRQACVSIDSFRPGTLFCFHAPPS